MVCQRTGGAADSAAVLSHNDSVMFSLHVRYLGIEVEDALDVAEKRNHRGIRIGGRPALTGCSLLPQKTDETEQAAVFPANC